MPSAIEDWSWLEEWKVGDKSLPLDLHSTGQVLHFADMKYQRHDANNNASKAVLEQGNVLRGWIGSRVESIVESSGWL